MLSYVKLCCLFYLFQERVLVVFSQSQLIKENSTTRPPSRHMEPKESVSSVFSVSDSKEARYGRSNLGQPDLDEPVTPVLVAGLKNAGNIRLATYIHPHITLSHVLTIGFSW